MCPLAVIRAKSSLTAVRTISGLEAISLLRTRIRRFVVDFGSSILNGPIFLLFWRKRGCWRSVVVAAAEWLTCATAVAARVAARAVSSSSLGLFSKVPPSIPFPSAKEEMAVPAMRSREKMAVIPRSRLVVWLSVLSQSAAVAAVRRAGVETAVLVVEDRACQFLIPDPAAAD